MAVKDMNLFIAIHEESDFLILNGLIKEAEAIYKAGDGDFDKRLTMKAEHSGFEIKFEETVKFDDEEK